MCIIILQCNVAEKMRKLNKKIWEKAKAWTGCKGRGRSQNRNLTVNPTPGLRLFVASTAVVSRTAYIVAHCA